MKSPILKVISVLWMIWGFVHVFAGAITMQRDTPDAVAGIADAVDPAAVAGTYHAAAGAVINQHGFNLFWIGLVTMICAVLIWRGSQHLLYILLLAAITGGLADVGYFIFMDLGGFVNFVPGTVMTIFSGAAILLSVWVWRSGTAISTQNS